MAQPGRRRWFGALLVAVAALAACAVLLPRGLSWAVPAWLRARGVADASLEVTDLGLHGVTVEALRLGAAPDLEARRVEITWTLRGLARGRLARVRASGVRLHAAVVDGRLSLGDLDALRGGGASTPAPALPVDAVDLEDLELTLAGAGDVLTARGRLALDTTPHGVASARAALALRTASERVEGDLDLDLARAGVLRVEASARAAPGALAPWWPGAAEGSGELDLSLAGRAPGAEALFTPGGAARLVRAGALEGEARATLSDVPALSGSGRFQLTLGEGALALRSEELALHGEALALAAPVLSLSLRAPEGDGLVLDSASASTGAGHLGDWRFEDVRLSAAGDLGAQGEASAHGTVQLRGLEGKAVALPKAELALRAERAADGGFSGELARAVALELRRPGQPGAWLRCELPELRVEGKAAADAPPALHLTLSGARLALGAGGPTLSGLALDARLAGEPRTISLTAQGNARVAADAPALPVEATAQGEGDADGWRWQGQLRDARGGLAVGLKGRAAPALGSGRVELALAPTDLAGPAFAPDGAIGGLLGVTELGGRLGGTLAASWSPKGTRSGATLDLEGVSLGRGGVALTGGRGRVQLDSLAPLRTPPDQRLAFDRLDAGVSLADGTVVFALEPGPVLRLDAAEGHLGGGRLGVRGTWALGPGVRDLDFDFAGIGLSTLVHVGGVKALDVTGAVHGGIEVKAEDGSLALRGGRLDVDAPGGRIAYRPAQPPPALAGAGAHGELVLTALRDFRYESLGVSVDGRLDREVVAKIDLLGSSPLVQEGRPIELHLTISSSFGDALEARELWALWLDALTRRAAAGAARE